MIKEELVVGRDVVQLLAEISVGTSVTGGGMSGHCLAGGS